MNGVPGPIRFLWSEYHQLCDSQHGVWPFDCMRMCTCVCVLFQTSIVDKKPKTGATNEGKWQPDSQLECVKGFSCPWWISIHLGRLYHNTIDAAHVRRCGHRLNHTRGKEEKNSMLFQFYHSPLYFLMWWEFTFFLLALCVRMCVQKQWILCYLKLRYALTQPKVLIWCYSLSLDTNRVIGAF